MSLVQNVLQNSEYQTVEIVARFLDAALIADKSDKTERAQNEASKPEVSPIL